MPKNGGYFSVNTTKTAVCEPTNCRTIPLADPGRFPESGWKPPFSPYASSGVLKQSWLNHTRCALRVNIVRLLTGQSLRQMSIGLADSALIRWFCFVNEFGPVNPQSKSTVDRDEDWIDADAIRTLSTELIQQAAGLGNDIKPGANPHPLGLQDAIELEQIRTDGTCLKANIHHPVDWVLEQLPAAIHQARSADHRRASIAAQG